MSVRVMSQVWQLELPDSQKIVLLALADSANDEGHCWPSMKSLVGKCSKGERTIQGVIQQLCEDGHLTRREVIGKGCNYTVHPRMNCAPQSSRPRSDSAPAENNAPPPQGLRATPAAAADKPSMNHQEPSNMSASADAPLTIEEVVGDWNELATELGLPIVRKITPERRKAFKARLRTYRDLADWRRAFIHIRNTPFLRGENRDGWTADFDFLLQAKSFTKLTEEAYGQAQRRTG
jgi:hypothetical protein